MTIAPPAAEPQQRRAVFLDRDGVINVDTGYPHRVEELELTPTAAAAIRRLNGAGVLAIVVTNQSGVARGMFDLAAVDRFHDAIQQVLQAHGARIDAFYVAPYHPAGIVERFAIEHEDRKPRPGMLLRALRDWPIDRDASVLIGDKQSDLEAAKCAGIEAMLVPSDTCDLARTIEDWLARKPGGSAVPDGDAGREQRTELGGSA